MERAQVSTEALRGTWDRWLAAGGIAGPIQFVAVFTIAGFLRPRYSPVDQAVSDLGVGENAWLVNSSLIVLGVLLVGVAVAFYRVVRPEATKTHRSATAISLGIVGVGFASAGVFPETMPLHWLIGAPAVFLGAPIAFLLAGLLLARGGPEWRLWARYSLLACPATVVVSGVLFYVFSFYERTGGPAPVGQFGGLIERVLFVVVLGWYVLLGWRLLRTPPEGHDAEARS
jgi:hypothetical membrane protein